MGHRSSGPRRFLSKLSCAWEPVRNTKSQARPGHAVILALKRLRQENHGFGASLGYIIRPCKEKRDWEFLLNDKVLI